MGAPYYPSPRKSQIILICLEEREREKKIFPEYSKTMGRTRTCDPQIRGTVPCPLGHKTSRSYRQSMIVPVFESWCFTLVSNSCVVRMYNVHIYRGDKKKSNQNTFLVAEGVIIIVQQCCATRWKPLEVRFQMTTEPLLCDQYFLRYL